MSRPSRRLVCAASALVAAAAIGLGLLMLLCQQAGLVIERIAIGTTPATVYRPTGSGPAPVVVVAHGFAGSQPLMAAFATTFARNDLIAITFDFPGHGRNPRPLPGDVTREGETTRALVDERRAGAQSPKHAVVDPTVIPTGRPMPGFYGSSGGGSTPTASPAV